MKTLHDKNIKGGYIALISAIIISFILISLTFTVSASGYFSRANVSNIEYKRVSLGLAESCANAALLKVAQNFYYVPPVGGEIISVGSETCTIKTASSTAPDATGRKLVYITTQAQYRGAWSNVKVTASAQDPSFTTLSHGTLIVYTHVINDNGGTSVAANFTISVGAAANPIPATFAGQESGTSVLVDSGSIISLGVTAPSGYSQTLSGCGGVITAGATKTCVVTEDDVPNTAKLTLIANVKNDNGGTLTPASIPLYIDGTLVSLGATMTLLPGTHKATSAKATGYATSTWGYQCPLPGDGNITLNKGDIKTCVIVYDDIPPPAPACVDTVLMLSGSMSTVQLSVEAAAAKAFLSVASTSSSGSLVSIGSFGGTDGSSALIPANGLLTANYGINGTTTSSGKKFPTGTTSMNQWKSPANVYAIDSLYATTSGNGNVQGYNKFVLNIPSNAIISGIEVTASSLISNSSGNPKLDVGLSWNGGVGTTTFKSIPLTTSEATTTLGSPTDTWGRTWTPTDLNDPNFIVFIKHNSANGKIISLNYLNVKIYYSIPSTGLYAAIDTIAAQVSSSYGNDVVSAIQKGSNELGSLRHRSLCKQDLILTFNGKTNAGMTDDMILTAADAAKASGKEIYSIQFGSPPSQRTVVAAMASGTYKYAPWIAHYPGSFDDTDGKNDTTLENNENNDGDNFFVIADPSSVSLFTSIFSAIGSVVFSGVGTPPPAPTRATLIVTTHVINDNGGPALPGDFLMTISPSLNASPLSPFVGVDAPGVTVTIDPGNFSVTETSSYGGYNESDGFGCSGIITAGDVISCTITNDDVTPPPPPPPPPPPEIGIGPWEEASSTTP